MQKFREGNNLLFTVFNVLNFDNRRNTCIFRQYFTSVGLIVTGQWSILRSID